MSMLNFALNLERSIDVTKQTENHSVIKNIDVNLNELGRLDEAIATYKTEIDVAITKGRQLEYVKLLEKLGSAYNTKGNTNLALKTYLKIIKKAELFSVNEKELISVYNQIASLYNQLNEPVDALIYANKGFKLIEKYPESKLMAADLYLIGAESYYIINNYNKAREYKQKYISLKDSVFSEQKVLAIADLEIKYKTEEKQKQILIERAELAEQQLLITKKNYKVYGFAGLVFALCFLGYLFYTQKNEKNSNSTLITIETQNKLQEQRLAFSRDLYDNIGVHLTFIISSIDNLKNALKIKDEKITSRFNTISDFTSSTIYELRDTIWAMNKREITFEDLEIRIANFIETANHVTQDINFQFKVDDNVDKSTSFTAVEGVNIYRVTQEAIHNTLKYAKASTINVEIYEVNNHIRISIKDNGKGFDDEIISLGNGIRNMKKRAHDLGGNLGVETMINNGTSVTLFL